jgi:subtilisin family serine protease
VKAWLGVKVSRLLRTSTTAALLALATVLATVPLAQADSDSLPPTILAIVDGDVTEYQWMLAAVNAEQAWPESTGAGTVVAVIDTGVDSTHPDLAGQVVPGAMVARDADKQPILVPATVEETSDDWYGHGSHVSGIVAADDDGNGITGIAPDAQIMPIALLTNGGVRSDLDWLRMIKAGVEYATANGADVINMSLGLQSSGIAVSPRTQEYLDAVDEMCAAVDAATAAGTVVVASAGNAGDWGNPEYVPGACPSTVTVAALAPSFDRTYWSSFDGAVDVAAPGLEVLSVDSTVADGSPTPHLIASGTSMASPVVAGVAALLTSEHPAWTADQIIDELKSSAQDIDVPGKDPDTGHGIVDAAAALGVATPLAEPQDDFSTWAEPVAADKTDQRAVVGWTTPDAHAVTGYTVTVHSATGTTDYDVDGETVRVEVTMGRSDGWTVTAHTTAGDVASYPRLRSDDGGGERPEKLRHVKIDRDRDSVVISWDKPTDPESIDVIEAHLYLPGGPRVEDGKLKVDQDETFPTQMRVKLSKGARWYDVYAFLELRNKDENGNTIGYEFLRVNDGAPAFYGSRIEKVLGAGPRAVEVTGGVSELRAERVCGPKANCAGELATLVIDRGRDVQRVPVRYNSAGNFHATIWIPNGAESVKLRVEGPSRLDSGPFRRFDIKR